MRKQIGNRLSVSKSKTDVLINANPLENPNKVPSGSSCYYAVRAIQSSNWLQEQDY